MSQIEKKGGAHLRFSPQARRHAALDLIWACAKALTQPDPERGNRELEQSWAAGERRGLVSVDRCVALLVGDAAVDRLVLTGQLQRELLKNPGDVVRAIEAIREEMRVDGEPLDHFSAHGMRMLSVEMLHATFSVASRAALQLSQGIPLKEDLREQLAEELTWFSNPNVGAPSVYTSMLYALGPSLGLSRDDAPSWGQAPRLMGEIRAVHGQWLRSLPPQWLFPQPIFSASVGDAERLSGIERALNLMRGRATDGEILSASPLVAESDPEGPEDQVDQADAEWGRERVVERC